MKSKYLIGLGGVAIIGYLVYLLGEKNKRDKASREKELVETKIKTEGEVKAKAIADARNAAIADAKLAAEIKQKAADKAVADAKALADAKQKAEDKKQADAKAAAEAKQKADETYAETPYADAQVIAKSLSPITIISNYLSGISVDESGEKNTDYSVLRKKYESLKDLVAYFKSNGALIVNNDFKVVTSTLNKKDADEFSRIYPKLYLKRVLKDFPAYFDKHSADYDLTPEEFIFIDSINYPALETQAVNDWILKSTPSRIAIKEAFYGRGANLVDVKSKILELIKTGVYEFPSNNTFAGKDPERGQSKAAYVNYTIDGKPYTLTAFNSNTSGFNKNWNNGGVAEGQIAVLIK
jgi:hypothetical protein